MRPLFVTYTYTSDTMLLGFGNCQVENIKIETMDNIEKLKEVIARDNPDIRNVNIRSWARFE